MAGFQRHEELLVQRGWSSLQWLTGVKQCIAIRRSADGRDAQRLTNTEFALVAAVAMGLAVKEAAAQLDIEWTTARTALCRALRKLGVRSCSHLPSLWHGLSGPASSRCEMDGTELIVFESQLEVAPLSVSLTGAERAVLQAVLVGQDNQQIARHRNASVRTIANQLAALFRKFGASSKAELAAKALLLHPSCESRAPASPRRARES